jgi:hypothetical protein
MFTSIMTNSILLLWRKHSFWVIQAILVLGPVLVSGIVSLVDPQNPISLGVGVPGVGTLALNYLVLPFLIANLILDDFGKVGEILWSGPLDNLAYFLARFCGLWLGLAVGSLLQITGWFLASLLWFNLLTEWVWIFSLAVYLLANTLGLSVLFLLVVLTRRNLPVMLGWVALWVWLFYTVDFAEGLAEEFYPLITTAFTNVFFHNLTLSPSLGLGLAQGHLLGMFAWFLGLSLLAFSLALLLSPMLDARRSTRTTWFAPALAGGALLATLGGYALNARAIATHAVPPSPQDVQVDSWNVLRQRTFVDVDARTGQVSGEMELELAPATGDKIAHSEIVLRLNSGLALTAVRDASGQSLPVERVGDSIVIGLPSIPQSPISLNLAWEGRLQIPYTTFQQVWKWFDAPDDFGFVYMPQALGGLVQPNGGFLLRDGDWMPWPWSTLPHQARQNYLEIRPSGADAAASVPIQDGAAIWQGTVPHDLLVFLPGKQVFAGGAALALSPLVGSQHLGRASLFSAAATEVARLFGVEPPRTVVIIPYLNRLSWSGDLLLIPDGSGYYHEIANYWLYAQDVTTQQKPQALRRAAIYALARRYLLDQAPPMPLEIKALLSPAGERPNLVTVSAYTQAEWIAGRGRWVQAPEAFDYNTYWDYRRWIDPTPQGEWSAVAFWLAMELADEELRQADLEGIAFFDRTHINDDAKERGEVIRKLIWPDFMDSNQGRQIILELHNLSLRLGTQESLDLFVTVLQETRPETVGKLLAEMEVRSQTQTNEVQP